MPVNSFDDHPLSWQPAREALGPGPVYLALAAALEADIGRGVLPPGLRLPPQRELADFLDIDFTTVTRAYAVCREHGLIYGVTGRGTFVSPHEGDGDSSAGVIDCGVVQGFPGTGTGEVVAAARSVMMRESAASLFSYGRRDGAARQRAAGAHWLARNGVHVPAERLAVFPGSQGAISSALLSLFSVGDALAVDAFTYANLISLAKLAHIALVPVESDARGMRPDALAEAASNPRVKGVFLMPHCANPTGISLSERRKDELADAIESRNLMLLEDCARLAPPARGERPLFARIPERTVYISGLARSIAPGLRVTFMAFPEKSTERLLSALHHLAIKASALEAEILSEAILTGRAERILREKAKKAREANVLFNRVFPKAPRSSPTALFRALPLPGTAGRGPEIERACLAAGVRVCHSDRFSVRVGNPLSFLRISISSAPDMASLHRALVTIRKTVF